MFCRGLLTRLNARAKHAISFFITKPSALSALDSLMHPCGGAVDLPGCQWHTPPGHIRQDAPDRKPGSLSGKKSASHTQSETVASLQTVCTKHSHILTFLDSIWHPSACSPSRPSPPCSSSWQPITVFWDAARRDTTPSSG